MSRRDFGLPLKKVSKRPLDKTNADWVASLSQKEGGDPPPRYPQGGA